MISLIVTVTIGFVIGWAVGIFENNRPRKPKRKFPTSTAVQDYCPSCGKPAQYVLGWPHCSDNACEAWGGAFWDSDKAKELAEDSVAWMLHRGYDKCLRERTKKYRDLSMTWLPRKHHIKV